MNCPKCGYARKAVETTPDGQCPSCGIYYAKFNAAPPPIKMQPGLRSDAGGSFKLIAGILVAAGLVSLAPQPAWLRALTADNESSVSSVAAEARGKDFSKAQIVMYSLTTCGYCTALRHELEANNIPFTEHFVDADQTRFLELTQKLQAAGYQGGAIGTPTLEVNGKMMPNNPRFEDIVRQAQS